MAGADLRFGKRSRLTALLLSALLAAASACSSAKKKDTPELGQLEGHKVALAEIDGTPTSKQVVEVALVNQLVKRGTFELISKQDYEKAKAQPDVDPTDWKAAARRAGAEYGLVVHVLDFDAQENEGYDSEVVEDSQAAEETGNEDATIERTYKVKSLTGKVRMELDFTNLATGEVRKGIAQKEDKVVADERNGAAHLPPELSFLEKLSNEAFRQFFEQYN